jgi:hypothetical protein
LAVIIMTQSSVVEIVLCNEGLFAAFELVEIVCYAGKEAFDFGADFGEKRGLGGLEVGF